jgi:hypothetical protein
MTNPRRQFSAAEQKLRGLGMYALATHVPGTPHADRREGDAPSIPCLTELLNAEEIAQTYLQGKVTEKWVRMNAPNKIDAGHSTKLWAREDVCKWIQSLRQQ